VIIYFYLWDSQVLAAERLEQHVVRLVFDAPSILEKNIEAFFQQLAIPE
jgi:hypothetical protein